MYLSLNLRNRILHFTIIGLIFLSFYTYYYAATNEIRQLSVLNTSGSQSTGGVIRSILSTKREIQSLAKNSTSESLSLNTLSRDVNGVSDSNVASNAENLINTSNTNSTNNLSGKNSPTGSSNTGSGGSSTNDAKSAGDANNAVMENYEGEKKSDVNNANDENEENEAVNKDEELNNANSVNEKVYPNNNEIEGNNAKEMKIEEILANEFTNDQNDGKNPSPVSTFLSSQPLAPPSLAKTNDEPVAAPVVKVEKREPEKIKVVPKIVKPDSAGAFYIPGHSVSVPGKCPERGANMSLLILIASAPGNFEARMAIRQTWGHFDQRKDVSIAFLLGESSNSKIKNSLNQEQYVYADVIHGRFIDSYSNLTLKTISAMEWVVNHCPEVKFVLKTDDDMFINVPRLLSFIRSHSKEKNVIYGRLARRWKPIRSIKSKYYVSPKQFKPATFPDFTTGPAYLFSSDVAPKLYTKALEQTYLKLEDVFTTGIVAHYLNIRRIQANEFLNKRIAFSPCNVQKSISIHMVKYSEQFDLWKKLLDGKSTCK